MNEYMSKEKLEYSRCMFFRIQDMLYALEIDDMSFFLYEDATSLCLRFCKINLG